MDFDLTEKQTYWRDRIRDHNERFLRSRVADYYAEQATGSRWLMEPVHAAGFGPPPC
jgi:acyl-CoA dehydrogenase